MSLMHVSFVIIAATGLLYFLLCLRQFRPLFRRVSFWVRVFPARIFWLHGRSYECNHAFAC